jgi:hypothetical protein
LEVSGAVRPIYVSLGVERLISLRWRQQALPKHWYLSTGCYAVLIGGQLPTLRDNISVPFSRVKFSILIL